MSTVGFEVPLWRSIAVFRIASLIYADWLITRHDHNYRYPLGGWAVLTVMTVWTVYACFAYAKPERRRWPLLFADLAVALACLVATYWVETPTRLDGGAANLTGPWVCGCVLAWGWPAAGAGAYSPPPRSPWPTSAFMAGWALSSPRTDSTATSFC